MTSTCFDPHTWQVLVSMHSRCPDDLIASKVSRDLVSSKSSIPKEMAEWRNRRATDRKKTGTTNLHVRSLTVSLSFLVLIALPANNLNATTTSGYTCCFNICILASIRIVLEDGSRAGGSTGMIYPDEARRRHTHDIRIRWKWRLGDG